MDTVTCWCQPRFSHTDGHQSNGFVVVLIVVLRLARPASPVGLSRAEPRRSRKSRDAGSRPSRASIPSRKKQ